MSTTILHYHFLLAFVYLLFLCCCDTACNSSQQSKIVEHSSLESNYSSHRTQLSISARKSYAEYEKNKWWSDRPSWWTNVPKWFEDVLTNCLKYQHHCRSVCTDFTLCVCQDPPDRCTTPADYPCKHDPKVGDTLSTCLWTTASCVSLDWQRFMMSTTCAQPIPCPVATRAHNLQFIYVNRSRTRNDNCSEERFFLDSRTQFKQMPVEQICLIKPETEDPFQWEKEVSG